MVFSLLLVRPVHLQIDSNLSLKVWPFFVAVVFVEAVWLSRVDCSSDKSGLAMAKSLLKMDGNQRPGGSIATHVM